MDEDEIRRVMEALEHPSDFVRGWVGCVPKSWTRWQAEAVLIALGRESSGTVR